MVKIWLVDQETFTRWVNLPKSFQLSVNIVEWIKFKIYKSLFIIFKLFKFYLKFFLFYHYSVCIKKKIINPAYIRNLYE